MYPWRNTGSLTAQASPSTRTPENTPEELNTSSHHPAHAHSQPLRAPVPTHRWVIKGDGVKHRIGHSRQDSPSRTSVPETQRRCTPTAPGYRALSPTATLGLLLKPSFHARRHPCEVSLSVQAPLRIACALGRGLSRGRDEPDPL